MNKIATIIECLNSGHAYEYKSYLNEPFEFYIQWQIQALVYIVPLVQIRKCYFDA